MDDHAFWLKVRAFDKCYSFSSFVKVTHDQIFVISYRVDKLLPMVNLDGLDLLGVMDLEN